jgi:dipeptidyl aminopeptidase/acylaminoacyl peptidase
VFPWLICFFAWTASAAHAATAEKVLVPWRAGNAEAFQMGAVEEHGARSAAGALPVTIYKPDGAGHFPFIVLLHGCGGLKSEAMWTRWVEPWASLFREHGMGTAVVDSFEPRGVEQVCNTGGVAAWAVRRADDAHSARAWLAEQPFVDPKRIAVMGMSNTFDMRLPDRTILGMRLGYDADATADARRQVIDFLTAHGMVAPKSNR